MQHIQTVEEVEEYDKLCRDFGLLCAQGRLGEKLDELRARARRTVGHEYYMQ